MKFTHFLKLLSLTILTAGLTSCIAELEVNVRNEELKLVVDGSISSQKPPYRIKLSYSGDLKFTNQLPEQSVIRFAKVFVTDDLGKKIIYYPQANGTYLTLDTDDNQAKVGRTYTLTIELPSGEIYQSRPEKIPAIVPIDKIYYEYKRVVSGYDAKGFVISPNGYDIFIDTKDPANQTNYYRWEASTVSRRSATGVICGFFTYCNTSCNQEIKSIESLKTYSDQYVNGNTIKKQQVIFSPLYATGYHYIEVSQQSLTREAYQFWKRFEEQQTRTGSVLDPLPASIEGNVYSVKDPNKLALGFFSVVGVYKKRFILDNTQDNDLVNKLPQPSIIYGRVNAVGACTERFDNSFGTGTWPPVGWLEADLNR
jgi:hypothetical protein